MTQPASPPQQTPVLMRRIGPLPLLVWLLLLILIVVGVILWRRSRGKSEPGGLGNSDLETSGAVLANPNLFTYPQSVYLYRDSDMPAQDDGDNTSNPAPSTPGADSAMEAQRWFGRKVPYNTYVAREGDDWFSVYDKFKPLWNPDTGKEAGPWNLFLYNHGRLNMSTTDWPSSTVNDPNGKKIPVGTVVTIPVTEGSGQLPIGGGMGSQYKARTQTVASNRPTSDVQKTGLAQGFKTSGAYNSVIPR